MRHPIQRLHACPATSRLYTAASNSLHVFDVSSGALITSWTAPESAASKAAAIETHNTVTNPKKKRKVEDITASPKPEPEKTKRKNLGTKPPKIGSGIATNNAISEIRTTEDGKYVVIVLSEDKAVVVLSAEGEKLEVLSTRWVRLMEGRGRNC